jgi:hypothetical protein
MSGPTRPVVLLLAAALAITACTADDDLDRDPTTDGADVESSDGDVAASEEHDETDQRDDDSDQDDHEPGVAPGRIDFFGVQQVHPIRALAGVTALTVDEHGNVIVDIEMWNRSRTPTRVASGNGAVRLEDDLGNTYELAPPQNSHPGRIMAGTDERLEAQLGFIGPIDPDASTVSLGLNDFDEFRDPDASDPGGAPRFAFRDLPLPGADHDDDRVTSGTGRLDLRPVSIEVDGFEATSDELAATIEIRRVTVGPLSLEVDVYARNDADNPRDHFGLVSNGMGVVAERDGEALEDYLFNVIRPESAGWWATLIRVEAGEEAEATVRFRAPLPLEDADSIRVGFNQGPDALGRGESLDDRTAEPRMQFYGVPLPERLPEDIEDDVDD